jgi:hypothetical protein
MNYQQEVAQRVYEGQVYQRSAAPVDAVEARYEARETQRSNGVARIVECDLDHLHALHGLAEAKAQNNPRVAYDAYRLVATAAVIYEKRLLWYGLG